MFRNRVSSLFFTVLWFSAFPMTGCGGTNESGSSATKSPHDIPQESPANSSDDVSEEEAALLAQIESEAEAADADAAKAIESNDSEKREVVYRVSSDGLKVEVLGAEFFPRAEAIRMGSGWGLKLTVEATSESQLVLFSPKTGPLALGGKIRRAKTERFGDRREGGVEVKLAPDKRVAFSRTWPAQGETPLQVGEELELHVGLWGIGHDTSDRRPLTRFVIVRMGPTASGAQPVVQPPGQ